MWSVLTISLFMLTLTDFMFFQVHRGLWCPIGLGAGGEGRVARLSAAADSLLRAAPRPTVAHLPAVSLAGRLAFRPLCSPSLPDATLCSSRRTTSSGDPAWLRTLLACSLILPMRAASGGGFSSVLAARGREDTHRSLRYSFACSEAREGGGRVSEWDGGERERDSTNAVPPHLRRDVSSVIQAVWPPRVAVLFQFGRALREGSVIREHSPGRSRCSGNPTDVRPRDASLVVSQALWICSAAGGTT